MQTEELTQNESVMSIEEAIRILHPDTTIDALTEIGYYAGFKGEEAQIKAVEQACLIACEALEKQIPIAPLQNGEEYLCPKCLEQVAFMLEDGQLVKSGSCDNCCQKLKWR